MDVPPRSEKLWWITNKWNKGNPVHDVLIARFFFRCKKHFFVSQVQLMRSKREVYPFYLTCIEVLWLSTLYPKINESVRSRIIFTGKSRTVAYFFSIHTSKFIFDWWHRSYLCEHLLFSLKKGETVRSLDLLHLNNKQNFHCLWGNYTFRCQSYRRDYIQ